VVKNETQARTRSLAWIHDVNVELEVEVEVEVE
jgi:hypothetical protein